MITESWVDVPKTHGVSLWDHEFDCKRCAMRYELEEKYINMYKAWKEYVFRFGGRINVCDESFS